MIIMKKFFKKILIPAKPSFVSTWWWITWLSVSSSKALGWTSSFSSFSSFSLYSFSSYFSSFFSSSSLSSFSSSTFSVVLPSHCTTHLTSQVVYTGMAATTRQTSLALAFCWFLTVSVGGYWWVLVGIGGYWLVLVGIDLAFCWFLTVSIGGYGWLLVVIVFAFCWFLTVGIGWVLVGIALPFAGSSLRVLKGYCPCLLLVPHGGYWVGALKALQRHTSEGWGDCVLRALIGTPAPPYLLPVPRSHCFHQNLALFSA